jgi:hypothetical protein
MNSVVGQLLLYHLLTSPLLLNQHEGPVYMPSLAGFQGYIGPGEPL